MVGPEDFTEVLLGALPRVGSADPEEILRAAKTGEYFPSSAVAQALAFYQEGGIPIEFSEKN